MAKVLIVEDSPLVMKIVRHVAKQSLDFEALYAISFEEAKVLYQDNAEDIFAALVDLNLPDAPNGEIIDFMLSHKVPTVVLTGTFDEEKREQLVSKGVVDYVTKEGKYSYLYAIKAINYLKQNEKIKVLVVEDSKPMRNYICKLLNQLRFQVISANDGQEALEQLSNTPDVSLVITDYNMPVMDGFELVKQIRTQYEKTDFAIIGLSAEGQGALSAKFIKVGANDFLYKPFNQEEFYCRVMHNIESLQMVNKIRELAHQDFVTGIGNRRYFFDRGEGMYQKAIQNRKPVALAVLDLDRFRGVNDRYGQGFGDLVLTTLAEKLDELLSRFLIARSGGNEFYVLMVGLSHDKAHALIDKVRKIISQEPFDVGASDDLFITMRAGITSQPTQNLTQALSIASDYLQRAKEAGGDMIIGD